MCLKQKITRSHKQELQKLREQQTAAETTLRDERTAENERNLQAITKLTSRLELLESTRANREAADTAELSASIEAARLDTERFSLKPKLLHKKKPKLLVKPKLPHKKK